jgi:hypothetical protein
MGIAAARLSYGTLSHLTKAIENAKTAPPEKVASGVVR